MSAQAHQDLFGAVRRGCRVWRGPCRVYELTHNSHSSYCPSQPRIGLGPHSPGLSTPKAPPDPPLGGLVSPWGAGAKNGRVNWGKLTRRKTPQHLEKQELGPGEGGQSLGSQNPSGAIIHPSVRGLPPAPLPTPTHSLWFQRRTNSTLCWARLPL